MQVTRENWSAFLLLPRTLRVTLRELARSRNTLMGNVRGYVCDVIMLIGLKKDRYILIEKSAKLVWSRRGM